MVVMHTWSLTPIEWVFGVSVSTLAVHVLPLAQASLTSDKMLFQCGCIENRSSRKWQARVR